MAALRHVAELSAPAEGAQARLALFEASPSPEPIRALLKTFLAQGRADGAFSAAAVLVAIGAATPEERTQYEGTTSRPPPVDLPRVDDDPALHAPGDEGPARELLAAAAPEITRALASDMSGGRGALVKGDNPVRRVVAPLAAESPALLVGAEVPKRWSLRQQRFLYARALAHLRRGTQAIANLDAGGLAALVCQVARLTAPVDTDFSLLPPADPALGERLAAHFGQEARETLSWLAARVATEGPGDWESLALGIRESAERVALIICGDPAAAISVVCGETQPGLASAQAVRLARFAVSDAYLAIRAR